MDKLTIEDHLLNIIERLTRIETKFKNTCPVGVKNATNINWLWTIFGLATLAFCIVIGYFHGVK